MTPAENPRLIERKRVLVLLVKKARALPIPVDNPANSVSPNAIQKFPESIDHFFLGFLGLFGMGVWLK